MPVTSIKTVLSGKPGPQIDAFADDSDYVIDVFASVLGELDPLDVYDITPAILLRGSNHDLTVHGTVVGDMAAKLGDDSGDDYGNRLVVSKTGVLTGGWTGVEMRGSGSIQNDGIIRATGLTGVSQFLEANGTAEIVNKGLIIGSYHGIDLAGGEGTSAKVVNTGTIMAYQTAAYGGVNGVDHVTNKGTIHGNVALMGGKDVFDNRGGKLVAGSVSGGEGNDTFLLGLGAETVNGGAGIDTLDFRSGEGLKVTMWDATGTGRATGDSYTGIERILGSTTGDDILMGNHAVTTLVGGGGQDRLFDGDGADRLEGGLGHDSVSGGAGKDNLYGGEGNDTFILLPWAEAADRVHDWGQAAGNNDRIFVNVKAFGGGLVAAEALGTKFVSRATSNEAVDGLDRFVFRQSDETLWFDKDGKGGAAGVMIADLQDGAVVTASDFLLSF